MRVVLFDGRWSVKSCRDAPRSLFIFGDNNVGRGTRGQACIRGQPNALGIPTKKLPSWDPSAYYNDDDYKDNRARIIIAISVIMTRLDDGDYDCVVLPADGLGTGLADLPRRAPKTFRCLNRHIVRMVHSIDPDCDFSGFH